MADIPEVDDLEQRVRDLQGKVRELHTDVTVLLEDVRRAKVPRQRGGGDITNTPAPQRDTDTY